MKVFVYVILLLTINLAGSSVYGTDWPEFLGTRGAAHSDQTVPTTWSDSENLAWKVKLPGSGSSSPIIWGNQLFVTCYVNDDEAKRQLLCFNKVTGDQEWSVDFPIDYREDSYQGFLTEHGYASNTPATDGEHVYAFFGKGGVHCVTMDGQLRWSVDVGKSSSNRRWGSASSVLLYRDTVIVNAADESRTLFCLDKETGDEVWNQNVDMLELTYGTPRIARSSNGQDELVISVPEEIWSLNPETGKLKWYASSPMTGNVSPSIIVSGDTVYSFGGFRASGSIAVKIGGGSKANRDVTDQNVVWTNRSSSYVATPVLDDGQFYWIDDRGIAYCTSSADGSVVYRQRVGTLEGGRPVYASPVKIGEHIYVVTRRSGTIVMTPGDEYAPVSQNRFEQDDTDFNASPAVSDGRLYLRSDQALYCIAAL
ncbi:MAG: PQQ-binding-like beta-propeller repeat protein [Planctomycetota bacterium]